MTNHPISLLRTILCVVAAVLFWVAPLRAMDAPKLAGKPTIVKRYHEHTAVELYNLRGAGPVEMINLAAAPAQAARVKEMRARLEAWMKEQGDPQTVFKEPRLLSDPASTRPGMNKGSDSSAPKES